MPPQGSSPTADHSHANRGRSQPMLSSAAPGAQLEPGGSCRSALRVPLLCALPRCSFLFGGESPGMRAGVQPPRLPSARSLLSVLPGELSLGQGQAAEPAGLSSSFPEL